MVKFKIKVPEGQETLSIKELITEFIDFNEKVFGDHSYSVGFLEAMLVYALMELPPDRREIFTDHINERMTKLKEAKEKWPCDSNV
jgi:hypothetical protein